MAEEEIAVTAPVEVEETESKSPNATDLKRKLNELEPEEADVKSSASADLPKEEMNTNTNSSDEVDNSAPDAKKPRLDEESDGSALENGHEVKKTDVPMEENAGDTTTAVDVKEEKDQDTKPENIEADTSKITSSTDVDADSVKQGTEETTGTVKTENQSAETAQELDGQKSSEEPVKTEDVEHPSEGDLEQPANETQSMTRRMEVPNNKVGVLIGKAGDTIRFLQLNSGAKIQITRDAEADPYAPTRPVELIGTLENINKAEKLIKDVIAEADAGGSPSLVARGFGTVQASGAADQIQIQVPNEKVGLIIGKGGETIKNLQTRSGARIQVLIPQHLPEGDQSKERTVRVTGDKKQIELARDMIKEVMSQPVRPSNQSGGYNQQSYRPRGPSGQPQWGSRGHPSAHGTGYDNQQRGMYPSQNSQYGSQAYGGYPSHQSAPRSNFNAGWDQRPGPMQTTPPQSGYDYYGHGGHVADPSAPTPMSNSGPVPASAHGAPPSHVNYNNYGQQGPDYGQPTYTQPAPSQQNYSHGYDDPKYANQAAQAAYGGHGNAQPAAYPQQVATQPGYAQQPYSKQPTYGMPSQGPAQTYGAPRAGQPGDVPYQNPTYGQTVPPQQPYPYAAGGPAHQTYPYNSAPPANDAYNQPPTHTAPGPVYPQPGAQSVPGYTQPGGQVAPGYAQGQPGGYGAYPSQPAYGEQPVPNNAAYGYQAPDTGYAAVPTSAYGAPPSAQPNYAQPASNQPTYEQTAPQSGGYANVPGNAPGYVKNLSPQPVYGQYDSTQMYGGQH